LVLKPGVALSATAAMAVPTGKPACLSRLSASDITLMQDFVRLALFSSRHLYNRPLPALMPLQNWAMSDPQPL